MFNLFKKKRPPPDPPTERQVNYARKLGIDTAGRRIKGDGSHFLDGETTSR
jgi:hypothetical protein